MPMPGPMAREAVGEAGAEGATELASSSSPLAVISASTLHGCLVFSCAWLLR